MVSISSRLPGLDCGRNENSNNAEAVIRALRRFGAPLQNITKSDIIREGTVFRIGIAPRRIDIITTASGLEFDEALSHALPVDIVGIRVHIPSVADLIRYKRASGRTKDLADAEAPENLLSAGSDIPEDALPCSSEIAEPNNLPLSSAKA